MNTEIHSALIVDDDDLCRTVARMIMQNGGVTTVLTAGDGAEAISILGKMSELPDIIMTDLHMPIMDGRELIERLREKYGEEPAILLLSADSDVYNITRAISAGADAYLPKPYDPALLPPAAQMAIDTRIKKKMAAAR